MARPRFKLSANAVRGATKRGRYSDGGNLHLQIGKSGTKAWVFLYRRDGISRAMGLGAASDVSLSLARELAAQAREQLARGLDPITVRRAATLEQRAARARLTTFAQCARQYFEANEARWTTVHRNEWWSAMRRHALPILGDVAVDAIDTGLVHKALLPLIDKSVTQDRLRGRLEAVLAFAEAAGRRSGTNPARKEVIAHLLPLRSEAVTHQPALPFAKVPALMGLLRETPGTDARLLETIILTALRHTAVRMAKFTEFDLANSVWTVPKDRTKSLGRDHRVPLSRRLVEIVRELRDRQLGDYVFGGEWPIGKNAGGQCLARLLREIGHDAPVTLHGFRSCLKDWAHEKTTFPHEVIEQALAHAIKSSVEKAYRRGDLFDRRRALAASWEAFCSGDRGEVIPLRA